VKKLNVAIRLGAYTSNQPPYSGYTLEITDEDAAAILCRADLTADQVAGFVVGNNMAQAQAEYSPECGTLLETKQEFVPTHVGLESFEVDGWTARRSDFGNHHRRQLREGIDGYTVVFRRNVQKEGADQ